MMRLNLTGINCADCPERTGYQTQLGFSGIYLASDGETLVCLFCASDRAKADETGLRCVLDPGPGPKWQARRSGFNGEGEPLNQRESAALLADKGGRVVGDYVDEDGEPVPLAEVTAEARRELGLTR